MCSESFPLRHRSRQLRDTCKTYHQTFLCGAVWTFRVLFIFRRSFKCISISLIRLPINVLAASVVHSQMKSQAKFFIFLQAHLLDVIPATNFQPDKKRFRVSFNAEKCFSNEKIHMDLVYIYKCLILHIIDETAHNIAATILSSRTKTF